MKIKALLLLIVLLLPTSPMFAISGGPWSSNNSVSSSIGTYSCSMRGENTIGFMVFSWNPNTISNGYVAIFSQGFLSNDGAQGYVDATNEEIFGVFGRSSFEVVTSEGENGTSFILVALRSDVLGSWEGTLIGSAMSTTAQTFEGTGEASVRQFFGDPSIVEISVTGIKTSQQPNNFIVSSLNTLK